MKKILWVLFFICIAAIMAVMIYLNKNSFIVTAYVAKKACGCHLLADRSLESIYDQDLNRFPLNLTKTTFDDQNSIATASLLGIWESKVKKTNSRGCILLNKESEEIIDYSFPIDSKSIDVPIKIDLLDEGELDMAFDLAFDRDGKYIKKTRALLVYHKDTLVREEYAEGFDKDTRILGWSMNKSIVHALIGILVKDDKVDIADANLFKAWENDERKNISIDHLLKMSSGLDWDEDYTKKSDATILLFEEYDCAEFAVDQPLEADPGSYWEYSSGTSNILSKYIRNQFDTQEAYLKFPYDSLFSKIGMNSMVLDTDQSGNYILSSYGYATPRDWAKFGLLYLNKGEAPNGEQVFPELWTEYAATPAEQSKDKKYGAHFWLNAGGSFPDVPRDMYSCNGFQGQFVFIIPSKDLVVVRMGLTEGDNYDKNGVIKHIVDSVTK